MNSIPCLICFFGAIFYIKESARFHICIGDIESGVDGINYMGFTNDKNYRILTDDEVKIVFYYISRLFNSKFGGKKSSKKQCKRKVFLGYSINKIYQLLGACG